MRYIFSALLLFCLSAQGQAQSQTKILLEKLTATWCGWCPAMNLTIDSLVEAHGAENVIVVEHHNGLDPMSTEFGGLVAEEFINGSPAMLFNRQKIESQWNVGVSRFDWAESMTEVVDNVVDQVEISSSHTIDEAARLLKIDIKVSPLVNLAGDYRLNCYIVEDDVHRPNDPLYYQINYWAGIEGHPFESFPNPIKDYKHKKVVRSLIGGPWGLNGSLPSSMQAGTEINSSFTYTIEDEIDLSKVSFVLMVQKFDEEKFDRAILNSEEVFLDLGQGAIVSGIEDLETNVSIYPNPVQDELFIQSDEIIEGLRLFNSQGQEMEVNNAINSLNVGHLSTGWYILQVKTNRGTEHHQFIRD